MTDSAAKEWANFLIKLGYNTTKKYIIDYIIAHDMSGDEVWNYFVEQHGLVKEAANANRFYKPDDVDAYFREVSYAKMRGTYPRRHNGRSFVVPRLKTIQELQAEKETLISEMYETPPETAAMATKDMIGLHVSHTSFGQGVITEVTDSGYLVVDFQHFGNKTLSYQLCMELGILTFE